ncbi:MAG: tyrosine-type recombinase/integrase [Treponema sp.]|nr:tyrosine-type recombinase/integrase [Treponema sp.]
MNYHAFKKPKKLKNGKKVYRWYYYWIDDTGKQIQKSCGTKVKNRQQAEDYIRTLPPPPRSATPADGKSSGIYAVPARRQNNNDLLVREIAETMYLPGSPHLQRRQQLKKSTSKEVAIAGRVFMKHIVTVWGDRMLRSLELDEVMNYLFSVKLSGSWKNQYISHLNEIYQEAQFLGCKIYKPTFPSIGREYNKADIFSEKELEQLFKPEHFSHDFYLFFLTALSGGLRLGEIRGLRVKQIVFEIKAVIIDGFMKDDYTTRTVYNKRGTPEHPKLRVVPYPDFTLDLLKQHIERSGAGGDDFVFTYNDLPISKSMASRAFTVALINAGLTWDIETLKEKKYWKNGHITIKRHIIPDGRRFISHSLRYTYITRMSRYMPAEDLLKLTGHDSKGMVDYYNRTNLEMLLSKIPKVADATSALLPQAIGKT